LGPYPQGGVDGTEEDYHSRGRRRCRYEQIVDQAAELKTFLEQVRLKDLTRVLQRQIATLERLKARLCAGILAHVRAQPDLKARFDLLTNLPGVGPVVAMSLLIRMPELGAMKRGQPAALVGVAPFDRQSGQFKGRTPIGGGRRRPRRMLYLAALAAKRFDPGFKAFATRLATTGKPTKLIIVAVMRKLIEAANLILARKRPWSKIQPA
jgi:transposase